MKEILTKFKKTTLTAIASIILCLLFFGCAYLTDALSNDIKDLEVQNLGVSSNLEIDKIKNDKNYPSIAKESLITDSNGNPIPPKIIAEKEVAVITKNKPSFMKYTNETYILMYFNKNNMCIGDWVDPAYTAYGGMSKESCIKELKLVYKRDAEQQVKNMQIVKRDLEINNELNKNNKIWVIDKYMTECSAHPEWEDQLKIPYPNIFLDLNKCQESLNRLKEQQQKISDKRNVYNNINIISIILGACFFVLASLIFITKAVKYFWVSFVALTTEAISKGKSKSNN